jgi:hypothetical protein
MTIWLKNFGSTMIFWMSFLVWMLFLGQANFRNTCVVSRMVRFTVGSGKRRKKCHAAGLDVVYAHFACLVATLHTL